jgi:hypothetical protein
MLLRMRADSVWSNLRSVCYIEAMTDKIEKRPGPDWDIYYMDLHGGGRECMSVFGSSTPEDAIAEARASLNAFCETEEEKDQFEILAVVRQGVDIEVST